MKQTTYFIAKVNNFNSLKKAIDTSCWACSGRASAPHPPAILAEAFNQGRVVIIFSVSNCHGWHGYAEMVDVPKKTTESEKIYNDKATEFRISGNVVCDTPEGSVSMATNSKGKRRELFSDEEGQITHGGGEQSQNKRKSQQNQTEHEDQDFNFKLDKPESQDGTSELEINKQHVDNKGKSKSNNLVRNEYFYFKIKWILNYIEFGELCLPSKEGENLQCIDMNSGQLITVTKCRNWQELDAEVGETLCQKMLEFYEHLGQKRDEKNQKKLEKQPESFYKETRELTVEQTWRKIVDQVERELGKVILACPFGSQRYNLNTPESDTDMFIVYQAKTRDVLGFHPPKQTIKNHESETCDYTIHEVYRYCELMLSGDARCVETLFLDDRTVVQASPEWEELKKGRELFLNRDCLDKFLRDAQGSKGTKYLQKWCQEHTDQIVLPQKMCKMLYVIVRLLQNARDIATGRRLQVYRECGSPEREVLMNIRSSDVLVADAWKLIQDLETEIAAKYENVPHRSKEAKDFLESWLLRIRYNNFEKLQ